MLFVLCKYSRRINDTKFSSFRFTLSIIPCSSNCMYEMPTGEFDVISRETHPPSYLPENDIASFERLEM